MITDITYKKSWTSNRIINLGFKLIANEKEWYHFRGHGFDVTINLNTKQVKGNHFNFHSYKNSYKGHFSAIINNEQHFLMLLKTIV